MYPADLISRTENLSVAADANAALRVKRGVVTPRFPKDSPKKTDLESELANTPAVLRASPTRCHGATKECGGPANQISRRFSPLQVP